MDSNAENHRASPITHTTAPDQYSNGVSAAKDVPTLTSPGRSHPYRTGAERGGSGERAQDGREVKQHRSRPDANDVEGAHAADGAVVVAVEAEGGP